MTIGPWNLREDSSQVAPTLYKVGRALRKFPFAPLLVSPFSRRPCLRFPLRHYLSIHFAEDLGHVYVVYGARGSRRGIRIPTFSQDEYLTTVLSEPGDPYKGRGSLEFLSGEIFFFAAFGKSYLRENNFYGPDTPALLEIFFPPRWEDEDFDIAGVIKEHVERHERCLEQIFQERTQRSATSCAGK